jgi:methyl-accepting chemotaxis protein
MEFRKKNVEHYRYLIKQKSSNKEVIIFSKAVKDFSSKTLSYLDKIEEFENKVDLSKRINGNFNDRIQRAINNILYTISRMKYTLEDFEKYTKEYESSNEDERTEANITNGIQRYMKWLKNQSDEINNEYEILDEIFNSEELKKIIEK